MARHCVLFDWQFVWDDTGPWGLGRPLDTPCQEDGIRVFVFRFRLCTFPVESRTQENHIQKDSWFQTLESSCSYRYRYLIIQLLLIFWYMFWYNLFTLFLFEIIWFNMMSFLLYIFSRFCWRNFHGTFRNWNRYLHIQHSDTVIQGIRKDCNAYIHCLNGIEFSGWGVLAYCHDVGKSSHHTNLAICGRGRPYCRHRCSSW